ncbi:MAG: sporulation protein YabP [Sporomusaceae bacterium]|nr:sporulation protein YabP [Sporomusaceae bacterium]
MASEEKTARWRHQFCVTEREEMSVDGVINLASFDEREVIMETEQGILTVKGSGLNIKQLNLEDGNLVFEGMIHSIAYDEEMKVKKGLLQRLLK